MNITHTANEKTLLRDYYEMWIENGNCTDEQTELYEEWCRQIYASENL